MLRAPASAPPLPSQVDIAIVTILQEEYEAVKRRLKNVRRDPGTKDQPNQYAWVLGEIETTNGDTYQVVLAMTLHPGNTSGSLGTSKTVARWRPRYVLLVGIAGGLPREQLALGDVVVSKQIVSYEYGKVERNAFNPRPDFVYQIDGPLLRGAASLGETNWRSGLGRRPRTDRGESKILVGIVGSGEKVIDDRSADFFAAVEKAFTKLLAVEMEGAGAAAAIQEARDEGRAVGFLMIRGISDMPPDKKTRAKRPAAGKKDAPAVSDRDQWKSYAANAAASFAVCFVSQAWPLPPGRAAEVDGDGKPSMRANNRSSSTQAQHGGKSLQIDVAIVALLLVGLGVKFPLPPDIAALNGSTVFAIYLLGKHALRWFNASFSLRLIAEYKVLHPTSSGFDG
jgi:nucleoside phosphorylase